MECPGGLADPGGAGEGVRIWAQTSSPTPAGDGPLRCKQLTVLLDWIEQFEAESRQSGEAVAFSVLLGDLNFDNCCLGEGQAAKGRGWAAWPRPPSVGLSPQTKRKSRSTSSSASSGTPAGWALAGSSPGPWVRRPGGELSLGGLRGRGSPR